MITRTERQRRLQRLESYSINLLGGVAGGLVVLFAKLAQEQLSPNIAPLYAFFIMVIIAGVIALSSIYVIRKYSNYLIE